MRSAIQHLTLVPPTVCKVVAALARTITVSPLPCVAIAIFE
jgi:hypothetical protein